MLVLDAAAVRAALPMPAAIETARRAYMALSSGAAVVPPRAVLQLPEDKGIGLAMPAYLEGSEPALVTKVVHLFPENTGRSLPVLHGVVIVFEPDTGRPQALLDGAVVTAIRTGAAGGVAADVLAREDARVCAVFGAGVQARTQAEAVCCVRSIEELRFYTPEEGAAESVALELGARGAPFPDRIVAASSPDEALDGADVVVTATTASTPVFADRDLAAGTHVTAVGSYRPDVSEIPAETVLRARVFVDSREAALEEAGELIQPLRAGLIDEAHVLGEIGAVLNGALRGRATPEDITLFKSVGVAVQDATAAAEALKRARELGLGAEVRL